MQITVTNGEKTIYSRLTDDTKAAGRAMSFLMPLPAGEGYVTTITNGGNDFTFRNSSLDITALVRAVEGIPVRTRTATPATS